MVNGPSSGFLSLLLFCLAIYRIKMGTLYIIQNNAVKKKQSYPKFKRESDTYDIKSDNYIPDDIQAGTGILKS